jgi:hypothetical protein
MKPERSNTIAGGQVPIIPDPWQSEAVGLPGQYSKTLSSRKKKKKVVIMIKSKGRITVLFFWDIVIVINILFWFNE